VQNQSGKQANNRTTSNKQFNFNFLCFIGVFTTTVLGMVRWRKGWTSDSPGFFARSLVLVGTQGTWFQNKVWEEVEVEGKQPKISRDASRDTTESRSGRTVLYRNTGGDVRNAF
jgi:hypothetical protein